MLTDRNGQKERCVYSVEELCRMLQVCKPNVYALLKDKSFRSIKVGKRIMIPKKGFDEWLDDHQEEITNNEWQYCNSGKDAQSLNPSYSRLSDMLHHP